MTSTGRPQPEKTERITQEAIDAVLSLWVDKNEKLSFAEIHHALVAKGIVQNEKYHYKTDRILKRLITKGVIEKHGRGEYSLKTPPEKYQLFEQLGKIRKREEMASFRIGGTFWTEAELYMLGFPEKATKYNYVNFALNILGVRIAEMFSALQDLAKIAKTKGKKGFLPSSMLRELFMELPSYYLGSRAGIDGDGLGAEELKNVYGKMLLALPQQASESTDWPSNTAKSHILETFDMISRFPVIETPEDDYLEERKSDNFALVITEAEWKVDEEGFNQRDVLSILKFGMDRGDTPFDIAYHLLMQDPRSVDRVLQTRGAHFLGSKLHEVKEHYNRMRESKQIANDFRPVINNLCGPFEKQDKKSRFGNRLMVQHMKRLKEEVDRFVQQYGVKALVSELPLYNSFGGPTPEKEEAIQMVLPNYSTELLHQWLLDGDATARAMAEKAINAMKDALNDSESNE